ncbi:MAG: hypothetical protein ABIX01_11665 [Chitinophagaceae bacterium]
MTIRFLQHNEIDKPRWDEMLHQSVNGLIYARSVYLDHLCPGWTALVSDDYRYVMPLTHKKKFGIGYLYQPPFCQQLGVFGRTSITPELMATFIEEAKKQFSFAEIFLNYNNMVASSEGVLLHKNYMLYLGRNYEAIRNGYTNDLVKKNLQRTHKFNLQYVVSVNIDLAVATFHELYGSRTPHVTANDYDALTALAKQLIATGNALVREVKMPNGELLACGLFLKDQHRIYNIASSTLPNGRTFEANHFLFDQLIQEFAGTSLQLDFEGSDIPGIERFYQKFGSVNQPYYFLKWNELPWPARLLKK